MTGAEMKEWFNILSDKYNAPYFNDTEIDHFLNDAQLDYVLEYVTPTKDDPIGKLEKTIYGTAALSPLIKKVEVGFTAIGGVLNYSTIEAHGSITTNVILPLRLRPIVAGSPASTKAARRVREMELDELIDNSLSGLDTGWITNYKNLVEPVYVINNEVIYIHPSSMFNGDTVECVVLVTPVDIDVTGDTCVMPVFTHRKIVAKAMSATGLVTEHDSLILMDEKTNG